MKTLIFAGWVAVAMTTTTLAQHTLTAQKPTFLKAPICTGQWQMKKAVSTPKGLLLIGQRSDSIDRNQLSVIATNDKGEISWQTQYDHATPVSIASAPDETALVVSRENNLITVTKIDCNQRGSVIWKKTVGQGISGCVATHINGQIGIVKDDGSTVELLELAADGQLRWETTLRQTPLVCLAPTAIASLSTGGYAVIKGSKIWGIDKTGRIGWNFGDETTHTQWETVRQISNGEVVVLGSGQPNVLNNSRTDAQAWGIAADGNRVTWTTLIGSESSREMAYDLSETNDGQLVVLCQRNNQPELVLIDHQHRSKPLYVTPEQTPAYSLRHLLPASTPGTWFAVGNTLNDKEPAAVLQAFRRTIITETNPDKKPSLYLVAIGVRANLQYTRRDAEAIADLFQTQKGGVFNEVHTDLFITDSTTTGGHLARTFDLLSTKPIQTQDLLVVFFSGNGQRTTDNYLLMGNDYSSAALRTTTLPISQLLADLNNLPGRKLVLLDACFSGAVASRTLTIPRDVSILAGSLANQVAFEDRVWQHGAFTKTLLAGLQSAEADGNRDGFVTVQELYKYVALYLPRLVWHAKNVLQQPVLWQTDSDFPIFKTTP